MNKDALVWMLLTFMWHTRNLIHNNYGSSYMTQVLLASLKISRDSLLLGHLGVILLVQKLWVFPRRPSQPHPQNRAHAKGVVLSKRRVSAF